MSNPTEEWVDWDNIDSDLIEQDDNLKALHQFLTFGVGSSVNVKVGDRVTTGTDMSKAIAVAEVNGTLITLSDGTVLDVSKDSIFKAEDQTIECPKTINISYGK